MVLIYSASVLGDTRIHSGFLLLRNKNKLAQRQHFQPRFTAKVTRNRKKKDSFLGGKMQESILMCGAKCHSKPKNCDAW